MNPIDRFTRDDVSAKVWWPLAMVLVVLFIVTFPAESRERDRVHADTARLGSAVAQDVVDPAYAAAGGGELTSGDAEALEETLVDRALEEHPSIDAIRLWAADGRLLASTERSDQLGSEAAVNDDEIVDAIDGSRPVAFASEVGLTGGVVPPRFEVYEALAGSPRVVAQVEFDDEAVLAAVSARWFAWRIALGAMGLLTLALAGLSMREPVARSGAGVPFYPTSLPPGSSVIDADDAALLQQTGMHARRRMNEMHARMEELEAERIRLEGELQRSLSGRSIGTPAPAQAIPRPAAPASMPEPTPPAPMPVAGEQPAAEPAKTPRPSRRRVVPIPEPEPVPDAPIASVPVEPEPLVEREPVVEPEPALTASIPVPDDIWDGSVVEEPLSEPVASSSRRGVEDAWAASSSAPVVHVPEAGPDSDDDVLAVLERLVEPVGSGARSSDAASDMRARLARTAAAKKPGSRSDDRFDHPEHR